jgi:hypothetical protein
VNRIEHPKLGRLVDGIDTGNGPELDEYVPQVPLDGCFGEAEA